MEGNYSWMKICGLYLVELKDQAVHGAQLYHKGK